VEYGSFAGERQVAEKGGYRVIYLAKTEQKVIWMLTMCPKNVRDYIPARVLQQIRKEVDDG
jgi:hypothetical protein